MARNAKAIEWTPAQDAQLTAEWAKPATSAPEIARRLGFHTKAIEYRAHHVLKLGAKPAKPKAQPKPKAQRKPAQRQLDLIFCGSGTILERAPAHKAPEDWNPRAWEALPGIEPVPFIDLPRGRCKWPIGDSSGAEMMCCGAVATEGAYCKAHRRRAYYVPPKPEPKPKPAEHSDTQMLRRVA